MSVRQRRSVVRIARQTIDGARDFFHADSSLIVETVNARCLADALYRCRNFGNRAGSSSAETAMDCVVDVTLSMERAVSSAEAAI